VWFLLFLVDLIPWLSFLLPDDLTRVRGSLDEMTRRHPRSTVRRAELVEGWADTLGLRAVAFVIANRTGLSFRDGYGHEELEVAARDIATLVVRSTAEDDGQHLAAIDADGVVLVEFWSPDDAGDVDSDLRAALRA
jgi:hypothetical protein